MRCLLLPAFLLAHVVGTADAQTPVLSVDWGTADDQGSASLSVNLDPAGKRVSAIQFDLSYQSQFFGITADAGDAARGAGKTLYSADQPVFRVLIAGPNQNEISSGSIAVLSLRPQSQTSPGTYPVMISNIVASDPDGNAVALSGEEGGLFVPSGGIRPAISGIANAASYASVSVAPGEIVVLDGIGLGPPTLAVQNASASRILGTEVSGTRVLFDGIPSPLLRTSSSEVAALVPYEVSGRLRTAVQAEYLGVASAPFLIRVAQSAPGLFTVNASGTGQAVILNEDNTVNGPDQPAAAGSVISVYVTGGGQTDPPGIDGAITADNDVKRLLLPCVASIGGQNADVVYTGSAPGQVSGLLVLRIRVPGSVAPGGAVPVSITIGSSTQPGVTLAIR